MPDSSPAPTATLPITCPILVVDDEEFLRDILVQVLDGYEVATAANGRIAIEMLQTARYHLVLTDLLMPEIDGFAVLRAVKALSPDTDVLVLTGYPSAENEQLCRELGCRGMIAKPFRVAVIRAMVDEYMQRRGYTGARFPEGPLAPPQST